MNLLCTWRWDREGQRDRGTEGQRDRGTEGQRDRGTEVDRRGHKEKNRESKRRDQGTRKSRDQEIKRSRNWDIRGQRTESYKVFRKATLLRGIIKRNEMAIYHFSGTVISRSSGKSAIASAAYRSGEKLYDEKQERISDYSRKQDILFKEIMLPKGAPEWMGDRERLWNEVERAENRKDAQLAREFNFALPRELSSVQNTELAKEFVRSEFVSKGMIADLCIHDGKTKDGEEQPHAHVMLTLREVTEEGFGLKERSWNAKDNLKQWRESWADFANKHLAMHGIEQRIDCRTLEEQGIDLEAQKKIGPDILRIHDARVEEHKRIAKENGDRLLEDPNIVLKAVTYHNSTFTHQDLARFINRHTIDADQFQAVYEKVKASEQIVFLDKGLEKSLDRSLDESLGKSLDKSVDRSSGKNLDRPDGYQIELGSKSAKLEGSAGLSKSVGSVGLAESERSEKLERNTKILRFTTKEMLDLENKMLFDAGLLQERAHITLRSTDHELENGMLAPQQKDALEHVTGAGDLKCLVGYAGTGKSRLLSQAREIWEKEGYKVHGATLSGIAAENLEVASGIESRTLASRSYYWDKGEEKLTKKDVLVIDEAGMLGSRQVARVLEEAKEGGAKVVLIGDPQQLQAIEAGAAFRVISERVGFLELTEIKRQQEPWQQEATKEFALQNTAKAISLYEEHGCVHLFETQAVAKEALVEMWNDNRVLHPEKTQIMLSYTRRDAQDLNEMARFLRRQEGELGEDQKLQTSGGNKEFAINDRIYFLQNDRFLGVKNGTLGTIEHIETTKVIRDVDRKVGEDEVNDRGQDKHQNQDQDKHKDKEQDKEKEEKINKETSRKIDEAVDRAIDRGISKEIDIRQEVKTGVITVRLDKEDHKGDAVDSKSKTVKFNLEQYSHITHGYAATIHKAQGVTVDESYVLASKHMDSHAAYVGMSRHREQTNLFWSKEEFADRGELEQVLGRDRSKDVTADYLVGTVDTKESREIGEKGFENSAENSIEKNIEKSAGIDEKINDEKSVSELVEELALLSKEHTEQAGKQENSVQKYVRELNELTQNAEQNMGRIAFNTEIREYLNEQDFLERLERLERLEQLEQNSSGNRGSIAADEPKTPQEGRERLERRDLGDAAIIREIGEDTTPTMTLEEKRAQELVEKYHDLEDRYNGIKKEGGSKYDEVMAGGDVRRCAQEICKDDHAMDYLQKNDKDLFEKMDAMREQEKVLEMQRNFEMER